MLYSDNQHDHDDLIEVWKIGESLSVDIQEIYWGCPGGNDPMECSRYIEPNQVVMQFTGLKDKNGKDIYEGDIIILNNDAEYTKKEYHFPIYLILHNGFRFGVSYLGGGKTIEGVMFNIEYQSNTFEVIGNIHQNPELLKGDNNG